MTTRIDGLLSARFQACCINYHDAVVSLFGEGYGIAKHLAVSLLVAKVKAEGFPRFGMSRHTDLWKSRDAKSNSKGYGVQIAKTWYWYDTWLAEVRKHCNENVGAYR